MRNSAFPGRARANQTERAEMPRKTSGPRSPTRRALGRERPTYVSDLPRQMPDLAARLGTPGALLIPLASPRQQLGLLTVGFGSVKPSTLNGETSAVRDAFVTTLELFRLRRREEVQT